MRFVQIPATVESSQMPPLLAVAVDQGRTESLLRWKKVFLSSTLTCGRSDILGKPVFLFLRNSPLKFWKTTHPGWGYPWSVIILSTLLVFLIFVTDSEDLIFPRTASRLGLKYQVHVAPYDSNPYRNPPRGEILHYLIEIYIYNSFRWGTRARQ